MPAFQACLRIFFLLELNAESQTASRVNLLGKFAIHLYFCPANDLVRSTSLYERLLKNQRRLMLLHFPPPLDCFPLRRRLYLQLLERWQDFLPSFLLLDGFTRLDGHNLVEFTGGIFARGGEILGQDNLGGDALSIGLFQLTLILLSHALIDLLWSLSVCLAEFGQ